MNLAYPLLILVALLTCARLLRKTQSKLALTSEQKTWLGVGGFCGAMIGAKLPFLWGDMQSLLSGGPWLGHGKTILSGIVGGYLGVEIAKWLTGVRQKTGDTFVIPVAIGVAIGRVGCFVGGCCYGKPTDLPWGVVFPTATTNPDMPRHPTQLYESLFHIAAAIGLGLLLRSGRFRCQLMKLYLIAYMIYRFLTEFLRPEIPLVGGLTGYQWVTLTLIPLFVFLWYRDAKWLETTKSLPAQSNPS